MTLQEVRYYYITTTYITEDSTPGTEQRRRSARGVPGTVSRRTPTRISAERRFCFVGAIWATVCSGRAGMGVGRGWGGGGVIVHTFVGYG